MQQPQTLETHSNIVIQTNLSHVKSKKSIIIEQNL